MGGQEQDIKGHKGERETPLFISLCHVVYYLIK